MSTEEPHQNIRLHREWTLGPSKQTEVESETPIHKMSNLELHIGAAIEYLENDANIEAAITHLTKAKTAAEQAAVLIARIGTTGVERIEVIQKAEMWPNNFI